VITVSNTAAPTVLAIDAIGARARFVDIDPATYLMDTAQLPSALTSRTRCVVPVHLFGQCVDMDTVRGFATEHGLAVVEDGAQAHGARCHGRRAGSMGDAAAFSFYPTKVLGAYGDGGIVLSDDEAIVAVARRLRYYGMTDRYYVETTPAYNSRLDTVQAEILRRKLRRLEHYIERRRHLAARYRQQLAGTALALPAEAPGNEHVYYLYVVRHPRRDDIIDAMAAGGVHLNVSYRWPVHQMRGFAHLGYGPADLPETTRAAGEIFSLPMFPSLRDGDQDRVCALLRDVLRRLDG
jgi:dTDP-3-amino-2,3,6-trideoxy-4-keto-D-glucose/dTDP-3-amino-3,4,6-trideoxy-alpha-D-glucose/dTDP-2,6-dideoxy-D-kanosamine transaminase